MAKKFLFANVDIEFPNGMSDDDYDIEPDYPPDVGNVPATPAREVEKIIEAGAAEDGFDIECVMGGHITRLGRSSDLLVDLVQQ